MERRTVIIYSLISIVALAVIGIVLWYFVFRSTSKRPFVMGNRRVFYANEIIQIDYNGFPDAYRLDYSLDGGKVWLKSSGKSLTVPNVYSMSVYFALVDGSGKIRSKSSRCAFIPMWFMTTPSRGSFVDGKSISIPFTVDETIFHAGTPKMRISYDAGITWSDVTGVFSGGSEFVFTPTQTGSDIHLRMETTTLMKNGYPCELSCKSNPINKQIKLSGFELDGFIDQGVTYVLGSKFGTPTTVNPSSKPIPKPIHIVPVPSGGTPGTSHGENKIDDLLIYLAYTGTSSIIPDDYTSEYVRFEWDLSSGLTLEKVKFDYSIDGGSSYVNLSPETDASVGYQISFLPRVAESTMKIRMTGKDADGNTYTFFRDIKIDTSSTSTVTGWSYLTQNVTSFSSARFYVSLIYTGGTLAERTDTTQWECQFQPVDSKGDVDGSVATLDASSGTVSYDPVMHNLSFVDVDFSMWFSHGELTRSVKVMLRNINTDGASFTAFPQILQISPYNKSVVCTWASDVTIPAQIDSKQSSLTVAFPDGAIVGTSPSAVQVMAFLYVPRNSLMVDEYAEGRPESYSFLGQSLGLSGGTLTLPGPYAGTGFQLIFTLNNHTPTSVLDDKVERRKAFKFNPTFSLNGGDTSVRYSVQPFTYVFSGPQSVIDPHLFVGATKEYAITANSTDTPSYETLNTISVHTSPGAIDLVIDGASIQAAFDSWLWIRMTLTYTSDSDQLVISGKYKFTQINTTGLGDATLYNTIPTTGSVYANPMFSLTASDFAALSPITSCAVTLVDAATSSVIADTGLHVYPQSGYTFMITYDDLFFTEAHTGKSVFFTLKNGSKLVATDTFTFGSSFTVKNSRYLETNQQYCMHIMFQLDVTGFHMSPGRMTIETGYSASIPDNPSLTSGSLVNDFSKQVYTLSDGLYSVTSLGDSNGASYTLNWRKTVDGVQSKSYNVCIDISGMGKQLTPFNYDIYSLVHNGQFNSFSFNKFQLYYSFNTANKSSILNTNPNVREEATTSDTSYHGVEPASYTDVSMGGGVTLWMDNSDEAGVYKPYFPLNGTMRAFNFT